MNFADYLKNKFNEAYAKEQTFKPNTKGAVQYERECNKYMNLVALTDEIDKQLLKSKIRKIREIEYQNGVVYPEIRQYELQLKQQNKNYFMITINFDDSKIMDQLKNIANIVDRKVKKKWIKNYIYCIEQRSDIVDILRGIHIHLIVEPYKTKRKSEIIREFYNSFKDYVMDSQKIDVRPFRKDKLKSKLKYIRGIKTEVKMPKVLIDKYMRNKYNLENTYSNDKSVFTSDNT